MRIEQYFLMTDYSLWEVILNGDSPAPTRVVDGSSSESLDQIHDRLQKLVSQLKIHGVSLSQEDVNLKFLQSLPSKWKTHTLIWRNKTDLEEQSLNDFTTEPVSVAASVSAICAKMHVSSLPNVDSLSNARTGRNLEANGPTSLGFDMSKVECYNCHRKGHFARECRSFEDSRRNGAVEIQRRKEEPANYAFMAFSSFSSSFDNEAVSCSKACSKAYAQLHSQYDKLTADFRKSQFDVISYQTGLESVEARLLVYKQNETVFEEDIKLLNLERVMKVAPSSLYNRFQPSDGYHAVLLPYTGTFMPPKPNLVFNINPTAVETDHSAFNDESETKALQIVPSFVQSTKQVKSPRHSVQHVETSIPAATPKPASPKPTSNGKIRNKKACFVCKSLDPLINDCNYHEKKMAQPTARNHAHMGNHKQYALMTHQNPQKHMVPTAVLTQSKPVPITVVRPVSAAVPKLKVTRPRHAKPIVTKSNSPTRRHINRNPSPKFSNSPPRVIAVKALVVNATQGMQGKWEWKPKCLVLDHVFRNIRASMNLKRFDYNDARGRSKSGVMDSGCSRHMTRNMSYLSDFEELNGGYVAFGGNPKGGKISGKGKIRIGKLDFDDVYFVMELKFNLFSVSQMCDKKNSVLFTNTACLVLSPDFKLPDESQVLLRVHRENNMYNVNLKNIVHSRDLTCLFAKATINESNLWHRRLGHINFKTMNKLVKGKFNRKVDEEFLVGYSVSSKAFRVFNSRPRIVQETLHVKFLENKHNVTGSGPTWLFDIDSLTKTMNYQLVTAGNQSNPCAGFQDKFDAENTREEIDQQYVLFPVWSSGFSNSQNTDGDVVFDGKEPKFDEKKPESEVNVSPSSSAQSRKQDDKTKKEAKGKSPQISLNSTNTFSVVGPSNATDSPTHRKSSFIDTSQLPDDLDMPELEDITYSDDEDDVGAEADFNNLETSITVSPIPTTRVHKDHPVTQIIGNLSSATQTRSMTRVARDQGRLSQMFNDDFHTCMFACFLSQEEPKRVHQALKDPSWIEAMRRIDYEEVFAPVARIKAIRLFLAYASFMGFMMYQMDAKSAFLYGTIEEEVYVCQPIGFEDPDHPEKVYKVVKALYGLHQAPRACKAKKDGIFISQDKYVAQILRKFGLTEGKSASTPIDTKKPLLKDPNGEDVDVYTYRSMIGSLMYLTSSRPDIMFAVCTCARFQVTPKASHLHAVKRIFRYLKGKPHLGLWYLKDSSFDLVAYSDSDYAGASLDRKSTTGGVNTPRCDEDRLEVVELTVFLLPKVEKVRIRVSAVDLQVYAVRHMLLLLVQKLLLFSLTNWCCSLSAVSLVRNVDSPSKFYMYPRFLQLMIRKQVGDLSTHSTKYTSPALTQKVFANMRRVGKGFSRVETPLFEGMLVAQEVVAEGDAEVHGEEVNTGDDAEGDVSAAHGEVLTADEEPSIPSPTPATPPPQPSQDIPSTSHVQPTPPQSPQRVKKLEKRNKGRMIDEMDQDTDVVLENDKEDDKEVADAVKDVQDAKVDESVDIQGRQAESQAEIYKIDLDYANKVLSMEEDKSEPAEVQEVVDVVTTAKIITKVVTAASETITAAIIRDLQEESTTSTIILAETKSKDKGKGILVDEPKPFKKKQQIEQDEKYARELQADKNKDINWDEAIDHVKKKAKEDHAVKRYQVLKRKPQTEAQARKNMMTKEQIEEDENKALKRLNETLAERAAKRRKLDEEVEELKRHFHIVPNKDDDVYIEATPPARKVPVVDYQIIELNNKPYYKIIRADDTHQLAMFEKPDIHAQIWKNQRSVHGPAKVKEWKLLESCGVQIITFTTTQLILLLERKYPLTRFTLDQMLNDVRLEVKDESEVSLELLRFIRQQHQEGQLE
uniref:CCHC-type domain-containing protein n=1 Tax=Tanacetum cinerariifolium TaxID=118510 RepID=A0A6L2M984_TANCI|nr:hypothetical protein [Tanacetum cinerariifolium]